MITIKSRGDYKQTKKFLRVISEQKFLKGLEQYGDIGVRALSSATPIESGATAASWTYEIKTTKNTLSIVWSNTNIVSGVPVAILIQYGHGTGTGGYVQGVDYINPALKPVFDGILDKVWKEVTSI